MYSTTIIFITNKKTFIQDFFLYQNLDFSFYSKWWIAHFFQILAFCDF